MKLGYQLLQININHHKCDTSQIFTLHIARKHTWAVWHKLLISNIIFYLTTILVFFNKWEVSKKLLLIIIIVYITMILYCLSWQPNYMFTQLKQLYNKITALSLYVPDSQLLQIWFQRWSSNDTSYSTTGTLSLWLWNWGSVCQVNKCILPRHFKNNKY